MAFYIYVILYIILKSSMCKSVKIWFIREKVVSRKQPLNHSVFNKRIRFMSHDSMKVAYWLFVDLRKICLFVQINDKDSGTTRGCIALLLGTSTTVGTVYKWLSRNAQQAFMVLINTRTERLTDCVCWWWFTPSIVCIHGATWRVCVVWSPSVFYVNNINVYRGNIALR